MTLLDLKPGQSARISSFAGGNEELETRLREIGFAEGDDVEIRHVGLFGGNPMSVRLNGTHIALRRAEAAAILVEMGSS